MKMTVNQLLKNCYQFYKSGNNLETTFEWLKDAYGETDGKVLMVSFVEKYSHDNKLMEEFHKSCFIR